jgi:hypothetical protein
LRQQKRLLALVVLLLLSLPAVSPFMYVKASSSLPLSAIGDDYLMWNNWNGNPEDGWGQTSVLSTLSKWKCTAARLLFTFSDCPGAGVCGEGAASTLVYFKLDAVLNYLSSVGVKAVLCDLASTVCGWYGSPAWHEDWVNLSSQYKGDNRIAAFEIANEPYAAYLDSSANTLETFNGACAFLIDDIRRVDSSRVIMMPIEDGIFTDSASTLYRSLVSHGIPSKGNILYDIVHPYYFQDSTYDGADYGNPAGKADRYWNSYIAPQIAFFGAENCWCGETFCWPRGTNVTNAGGWDGKLNINYNDQQTFERRMINYFVNAGVGFQIQQFITSSDNSAQVDALTHSEYYNLINSVSAADTTPLTPSIYNSTPLSFSVASILIMLAFLPMIFYVIIKVTKKLVHS